MKIIWSPEALADLADIGAYLRERNSMAARGVTARIVTAVKRLRDASMMGSPDAAAVSRELHVSRSTCFVFHEIAGRALLIHRIHHTSRQWPVPDATIPNDA